MREICRKRLTFFLSMAALLYFAAFCPNVSGQCILHIDPPHKQQTDLSVILSRATTATSTLPDGITKARLFQRVARILWTQDMKADAAEFFECAMGVAAKVTYGDSSQTRDPFASIDLIFDRAQAGDFSGALLHVGDFSDAELKDRIRCDVVTAAGQQSEFELAEHVLQSISAVQTRDSALRDLAMRAGWKKHFAIAERAARAIRSDIDRVQALSILAVEFSRDGQRGHASLLFSGAVDIAKRLPSDDDSRKTGGAPQFWAYTFDTMDTMLGFIAIQQLDARLDSDVADTFSMIQDVPARALIRHILAVERDTIASSIPESQSQAREVPSEEQLANSSPAQTARKLASTGDYATALSFASGLDDFDRVSAFEQIAEAQVERTDTHLALEWADRLHPMERAPTLIAIAEAIVDQE
jgi:hypothetical protein